jgi:hypothetical protein
MTRSLLALSLMALLLACGGPATTREQREETHVYPEDKLCNGAGQPTESADGAADSASLALEYALSGGCP